MPRYHQIAQTLRERIATSGQGPGERLDNQRSLAREFGVTLMTLRHALDLLERDGLIARRHGLGTFVARPAIDYDILHLRALAGDLSALGEDVATRFLRSRFEPADRRVAEALGLPEQAEVFVLERLRLVDGEPVSFQASYLPAVLGAEVSRADLAVTPLRQVLTFKLGIEITAARETVSAVPLDRRAARELGCRPGSRRLPLRPRLGGPGRRPDRLRPRLHPRRPLPHHPQPEIRHHHASIERIHHRRSAPRIQAPRVQEPESNGNGCKDHGSHLLTRRRSNERRRREEAQPPNRTLSRSTTMKELQGMKGPHA